MKKKKRVVEAKFPVVDKRTGEKRLLTVEEAKREYCIGVANNIIGLFAKEELGELTREQLLIVRFRTYPYYEMFRDTVKTLEEYIRLKDAGKNIGAS